MNTKMTKENAELIYELLTNAGWMDEPEENLANIVQDEGKEAAEKKMGEINDLIYLINPLLDDPINIIDEDLSDDESDDDCECEESCRN